ncbi:DMT family transporter [Shewanella intestini]|uniref:DMT family transporter n=1 Tax=Shewanella intestini TaxID=2017544 RepID=A0ABS5I3M8_9GAMM|nr:MULTISPECIES: DMT family transporter [Shewanella]MBR9727925.1 DMT family transporter [Shewanella intestini]MRG36524.1 EamA family transporter [Shewanella sp. XMDDZSB0408]
MSATIPKSMSGKVWLMLIVLSVLWGGSFFFIGVAVKALPALTIVTLRVTIAAIALWLFILILRLQVPKNPQVWLAFIGMGILNNVIPFGLIVWGQTHIASGLASILNAMTPIFAVLAAAFLLPDEKPSPLKLIGVLLGFIGVVIMIGVPALSDSAHLWAELAIVAAAMSYALAGIYGRRFTALGVNPIITAAGQVTASAMVLLPMALVVDGTSSLLLANGNTWGAIIALAVVSTSVAYVLYFKILALAGATNVLLVTLLVPVSAVLLGTFILGETLGVIHLIGMGLIALGLSAIDGRLWKKSTQ